MAQRSRLSSLQRALTRSRRRILLLSVAFGLGVWAVDAFIDRVFFYDAPFLSLLITDVPEHELYIRTVIVASFLLFGIVVWRLIRNLREREEELGLFRTLIDASNDSVYVIDGQTGQFIDVNRRACDLLGYERAELLEMGVPDIQADIEDQTAFQQFIASEEGHELANQRYAHQRADGTSVPVEISATSVEVNGTSYRLAIARDISERVAMEEEMRQSKERYRSLFTSIRDAILVADLDRRIIDCNPAFTSLFGYELDEIEGKPTQYIYADEDEYQRLGDELADRDPSSNFFVTINYERKSGDVFPGETNVFHLLDDEGNTQGFVGLVRDVSGRRQTEMQLKVIDRILRHNLRNDLNVISGNAEILAGLTNGEGAVPARNIETTSRKLIELADKERKIVDLLTGETRRITIDLHRACETAADVTRVEYPEITIDVSCPGDLHICGVPDFREAIGELLENAAKHGDGPEMVISLEATRTNGSVTIRVTDTGPGLPEEEGNVLVGAEEMEPLSHGSGLGLWLVNLMVSRSNGSVAYETGPDGGTTVIVTMPVSAAES